MFTRTRRILNMRCDVMCMPYPVSSLSSEFQRGVDILNDLKGKTGADAEPVWQRLLEETDFFFHHRDYLDVRIVAADEEQLRTWCVICCCCLMLT